MTNIIDYVEKEMRGFDALKFNLVDSLVLSQFAYVYFDQIIPGIDEDTAPVRIADLLRAENFAQMFQDVRNAKNNRQLLFALAASPRFRDVEMLYYVDSFDLVTEKQFSAVTYLLTDGTVYIAYRGTDATFVGWKEDFNMAFMSPVPAQQEAVQYLNTVADRFSCNLRTGGHSKGGNLAVYSAMQCQTNVQNRILDVYSHDGPGFKDEIFHTHKYESIKERIHKTLPQSSLIGMLLQQQENYLVVESNRFWIMQHDPFSWVVDNGNFCYLEKITDGAAYFNKNINQWVCSVSDEKRDLFITTLYSVIKASGAVTFNDLSEDRQKRATAVLGAVKGIDAETRRFVLGTIKSLAVLSVKNLHLPSRKPNITSA